MIKMELVSNPSNMEQSFVRVEIDSDVVVYQHDREFSVDTTDGKKSVLPNQIPFYSVRG